MKLLVALILAISVRDYDARVPFIPEGRECVVVKDTVNYGPFTIEDRDEYFFVSWTQRKDILSAPEPRFAYVKKEKKWFSYAFSRSIRESLRLFNLHNEHDGLTIIQAGTNYMYQKFDGTIIINIEYGVINPKDFK